MFAKNEHNRKSIYLYKWCSASISEYLKRVLVDQPVAVTVGCRHLLLVQTVFEIVVSEVKDDETVCTAERPSVELGQTVMSKVEVSQGLMKVDEGVIGDVVDGVVRHVETFQTDEAGRAERCEPIERQVQSGYDPNL